MPISISDICLAANLGLITNEQASTAVKELLGIKEPKSVAKNIEIDGTLTVPVGNESEVTGVSIKAKKPKKTKDEASSGWTQKDAEDEEVLEPELVEA